MVLGLNQSTEQEQRENRCQMFHPDLLPWNSRTSRLATWSRYDGQTLEFYHWEPPCRPPSGITAARDSAHM